MIYPDLITQDDYQVRQIRRSLSKVSETGLTVRLLWLIHEKGDEAQRARLKEVIRTPKIQSLVRQHDRFLLHDLGLGPKRLTKIKGSKPDRPWHLATYKLPTPCEKPLKKQEEPAKIPQRVHYTEPTAAAAKPGYWNYAVSNMVFISIQKPLRLCCG